jgi:DNA mismatch endonuclease (patch repair protein)
MSDVFTKAKRSDVMSRIRGRGNKDTELALVKLFRDHRITGWRRHQPLFGKPDFIFRKERLAVFVDGCFWHGCPRCYIRPKSNRKFWDTKIARNRVRDRQVNRELKASGWRVLRIWEHQLRRPNLVVRRIASALASHQE